MSILEGALSGLASAGTQQLFTDYNRQQDFANYKEAQVNNQNFAQQQQFSAPIMTKLGMAAAGLNPAQMNNPTPTSAPSAPLNSHLSPAVSFAGDTASLAQSRLANAEAEKVELQNDQTKHENSSSYENYRQQLDSLINMYQTRGYNVQASRLKEEAQNLDKLKSEGKLDWNVGDLRGALQAFGAIDKVQERLQTQIERQFETEKNFALLDGDQAIEFARLPKLQREMLEKQISTQIAIQALLASQDKLTKEQYNEVLMMEDKIGAEIAQLEEQGKLTKAQANLIRNADWKSLFADGKILAGSVAFVDDYTKEILHTVGGLAHAIVGLKNGKMIADKIGTKTVQHEYVPQQDNGGYHGYKPQTPSHRRTMLQNGVPLGQDDYEQ